MRLSLIGSISHFICGFILLPCNDCFSSACWGYSPPLFVVHFCFFWLEIVNLPPKESNIKN
jgi:hypothetical protein